MSKEDNYEQFLRSLIETEPIEITPDMIAQELHDELDDLLGLSQESLCKSCLYKQLEHADLWCYMFKEMPRDCHKFRKGECHDRKSQEATTAGPGNCQWSL